MEMGPTKAPGVDGTTVLFYQSCLDSVGANVIDAIKSFFHSAHMLRSINQTLIILIPKVGNPHKPNQFRPISLCSISYKLISKVLANRLRPILPELFRKTKLPLLGVVRYLIVF